MCSRAGVARVHRCRALISRRALVAVSLTFSHGSSQSNASFCSSSLLPSLGDHFHPSLPFTHRLQNPLGPKEGILIPQLTWIWSRGISAMYFSASSEGKTCRSFISPTSSQVGLNCLEWFFFSLKLASFPRTHSSSLPMAAAVKPLCSQLFI